MSSWLRITDWGERYIGCTVKYLSGGLTIAGTVKDREHYLDVLEGDQLWLSTAGPKPTKYWSSEVKDYARVIYDAMKTRCGGVHWEDLEADDKEHWYYTASEGLKWADFPGRRSQVDHGRCC